MTTAPGWYDDGHGAMRWWDGANWTEHVAEPDPDEIPEQPTAVLASPYFADQSNPTVPLYPEASRSGYPAVYGPDSGYPGGYPGGHPGAYPNQGGAFIAATEPRKSRLWIVWVVLGVIVLGIVVAFSVLVPLFFMALPTGSSSSAAPTGTSTEEPTDDIPATADEQAAAAAVELYDLAYQNADCDAYFASTTPAFREAIDVADCAAFATEAADFADAFDDYVTTVTSTESDGDSVTVNTSETFTSIYDEDGNETAQPQSYEIQWEYDVVPTDDGWAVDDSFSH